MERQEFVLVFDKCNLRVDQRVMEGMSGFLDDVSSRNSIMSAVHDDVAVQQPPNPSPGMVNRIEREKFLAKYEQNPLQLEMNIDAAEKGSMSGEGCQHFIGFGFCKHVPYYAPGTLFKFPSTHNEGKQTKVTGMVTACGQRNKEYAVLLSVDRPIWLDEASALFSGFQLTEIEDHASLCKYLAELVWRYHCVMGDIDPSLIGSRDLQLEMLSRFGNELHRMREAVQLALSACDVSYGDERMLEEDFASYKSSLMVMMSFNPLGIREWMQRFESYMSCSAVRRGLGYMEFVLY
jgi:hypothetical protein